MLSRLLFATLLLATPSLGAIITYSSNLSGALEAPPNSSPGTGFVILDYDDSALTLRVRVNFAGLTGNTTAAHLHCCTAAPNTGTVGVATTTPSFVGFPTGVTSGTMDQTYDLTVASSFNATFVTAQGGVTNARNNLVNGIANGTAYFNIHSTTFGGGEIRGFFTPVPEPATLSLGAFALASMALWRRRKS